MHLARLELHGFKTFAQKTGLVFPSTSANGGNAITCIVGPNGSGKSNVADAIRWALGEQSLKLLRGKQSQDVIFSGSAGRGRAGFAEVSLTFDNRERAMPIDFAEVVITRRLYRDGESAYLLNGTETRLSDIRLLLAEANVGQQSYSVIGQGMVDHILLATPEERKAFFDDATGVKPLQLKRHEAMLKLKRTYENLEEVEMLLRELEPRLKSLKRQVNRLEKRGEVEAELRSLQTTYYGSLWWNVQDELLQARGKHQTVGHELAQAQTRIQEAEGRLASAEAEDDRPPEDAGLLALQKTYRELQQERTRLRDEEFELQRQLELAKVRAQSNWAPLPLSKIIAEVEDIHRDQQELLEQLRLVKALDELPAIEAALDAGVKRSSQLVGRLQRPAPEDFKPDPGVLNRIEELRKKRTQTEKRLDEVEQAMEAHAHTERRQRSELFEIQRDLRERQRLLHELEMRQHAVQIDLARLEERERNLGRELETETKDLAASIRGQRPAKGVNAEALFPDIQRLRYQLELIGGIDPEIVKEYEETNGRWTFLEGQVGDLRGALKSTEKIVDELDQKIRGQSEEAFRKINREFERFFKILFGGGSCELVKLTAAELAEEGTDLTPERALADTGEAERQHEEQPIEELRHGVREREDRVLGIDIQATPPGKKLKALNLLSGGERALTSIALVSAIMTVNPAPFVVLDEVDAALDEANTLRFAAILEELRTLTQFIVITHNRASMEKADVLYGVTMGDDGVSNLLSVKLSDMEHVGTARR
ncbi:chromosome segregation protein SMC [Candidatus Uhrbacteria bacterium]|nr:chromosome segregation protein SMC [Candidatus Uhrbacteria bacterium]